MRGLLNRYGILLLLSVYVFLNIPLLARKPETFEQVRVFSVDEGAFVGTSAFSSRPTH